MTRARLTALFTALWLGSSCHAAHQALILERAPVDAFYAREVPVSLRHVDERLTALRYDAARPWCELCTTSLKLLGDAREYCVMSRTQQGCFMARETSPGHVRFLPSRGQVPTQVVRALWNELEPGAAAAASMLSDEALEAIAQEEEDSFVPRWSMTASARVGSVVSFDPPAFTFGGSVGFRRWVNPFLIPGATIDVEHAIQGGRSYGAVALNGRAELSLWSDDNARWFNVPRVSFFMGGGPLVGIGFTAALGGRAVAGVQLNRLGPFPTPVFFEFGFQVLDLDRKSVTGLRVSLGAGF